MDNVLNLTKIIKREHQSNWVAIAKDYSEVLDYSEDLLDLRNKIGNQDVVYLKIPESGRKYAF